MRPNSLPLLPAEAGPAPQDLLLDLVLPSRPEELGGVRDRLDAVLGPLGLDEAARDRIGLATHEAVVNAMIHGNRRDPGLPVGLRVLRDGGDLVIRVADRGAGLRPRRRRRPAAAGEPAAAGRAGPAADAGHGGRGRPCARPERRHRRHPAMAPGRGCAPPGLDP